MSQYDKWVSAYRIDPPEGGIYVWGAKAKIKKVGTGRTDDVIYLSEHLAETKDEAESKATLEAEEWIASRGKP
jgi:hypothetical protein